MTARVRIGAVSYLNTRPLVFGLRNEVERERIDLSFDVPSKLSDRMLAAELDIALLPVVELARMPELELVPGLGIVTRGASRSVLLVSGKPVERIRRLGLDADSRTSNALVRILLRELWGSEPECAIGPGSLEEALREFDGVVRIGDKALFEPIPDGCHVTDLAQLWTEWTGLPFVFAVWAARPGVLDRELYRRLHLSRRRGSRAIAEIAQEYGRSEQRDVGLARDYLTRNILFRLGAGEVRAIDRFLGLAARQGLIDSAPTLRMALPFRGDCHQRAGREGLLRRSAYRG